MIVRKDQAEVFRQQMVKSFEDRMVAHLNEAFPAKVRPMDEVKLREEIRYGMARARQYNIETERDVARFIDLMFLVRRDFDTSPETLWSRPILTDKVSSAENRLRRLQLKASQHASAAARSGR